MAGHSQFKNIMHRKGAQDKKRAKIFTKLTREIITSAKMGLPDPSMNPRLRAAIQAAAPCRWPAQRFHVTATACFKGFAANSPHHRSRVQK